MMGKGHFTKFTLLHAVIIHIPARFLGHSYCFDAAVLDFHNEAAVIIASLLHIFISKKFFTLTCNNNNNNNNV